MMILQKVSKYTREKQLLSSGNKVLVALSGGADSVALLRILMQMDFICEAVHCNFHLRGKESDRDEQFVRDLCLSLNVPLYIRDFNTINYAKEKRISIEMAARELRYQWFEEMRIKTGSNAIAVAHHKDDSVETLLLNLIRGTGINGLCGIRPQNGFIVRPLLAVDRNEIINYLNSIQQPYVIDSTNLEDEYIRNKIRHHIIPLLEEINPSVKDRITDTALHLTDAAIIYNAAIKKSISNVINEEGIHIKSLLNEASPHSLLYEIVSPLGFNSAQAEEIFDSLDGQSGKIFLSKEWRIVKDRNYLITQRLETLDREETEVHLLLNLAPCQLDNGKEITLEIYPFNADTVISRDKNTASFDADKVKFPLSLRKWKTGDSFIPFGMKGRKKISDYLTDRKFSIPEKEQTYVLCSGDNILWVVGERSDNRFRITDKTKRILIIQISD